MDRYDVYQVDAFTRTPFAGNPAGVVPRAAGLTDHQMQAIARELNNSETAFLLPARSEDHQVRIRYFTPTMEVPSCGHATIAAHYVRALELGLDPGRYWHRIGIGTLPVDLERVDGDYRVFVTQRRPEFSAPLPPGPRATVLDALGLAPDDLDGRGPVQIVDTGHSKLIVPLRERDRLHALRPDMRALARLGETLSHRGVFVFTLDAEEAGILAHARMFAPHIGIDEDPVTGNGHGPLGAFLAAHDLAARSGSELCFRSKQGEAMGRPGTAHVRVSIEDGRPARVRVGGDAVVVFRTEMDVAGKVHHPGGTALRGNPAHRRRDRPPGHDQGFTAVTGRDDAVRKSWCELESEGARLRVACLLREGQGVPVVLLHGFGATKEDFADLMIHPDFRYRTLLAYDAPGFGETECHDLRELSIPFLRKVAGQVIDRHGWRHFHVVGHSMGGLTALCLALENPGAVASFMNIEGNLAPEDCFLSRRVTSPSAEDPGVFLAALVDDLLGTRAYSHPLYGAGLSAKVRPELVPSLFRSMVDLSDNADLLRRFLRLPVRKSFVHGSANRSLSYLDTLKRNDVRVAEIPHSGHFPMYANPPALWAELRDFLTLSSA